MKGIILAGGNGTRLSPITKYLSKQLIPVYDKPLIYYPLTTLILSGVTKVAIVCKGEYLENFNTLLGDGKKFGIEIEYVIQKSADGLAAGLKLCKQFLQDVKDDEPFYFILGDNIFLIEDYIDTAIKFRKKLSENNALDGLIFGLWSSNPTSYGNLEFDDLGKLIGIYEKPTTPLSNWIVPGLYIYKKRAIQYIDTLFPSSRGELEITDFNQRLLQKGGLSVHRLGRSTIWYDAGTIDDLLEASSIIRNLIKRTGLNYGCPEEAAFNMNLISSTRLHEDIKGEKSAYFAYLRSI
jgi:glucose-1-phosphate thymidylyltransferase